MFLDGSLDGQNQVFINRRKHATHNHHLGIEEVHKPGNVLSKLIAQILKQLNAEGILAVDCINNHFEGDIFVVLNALREYRLLACFHALHQVAVDGTARSLGFKTALLAAVTDDAVVEHRSVPELAGKARHSRINLAIDDDAQAKPPAHIHKEHVLLLADAATEILAIGHCAGVVVDAHRIAHLFGHKLRQGHLAEVKPAVAIARLGIHAPRHIHADVENLALVDNQRIDESANDVAQIVESLLGVLEGIVAKRLRFHQLAIEVDKPHIDSISADIHTDKIAGIGI